MASNPEMNSFDGQEPPKGNYRHYELVPTKVRSRLIQMVFDQGVTVYLAAKVLNLNYSTAKAIAKKFRRNKHTVKSKEKNTRSTGTQTEGQSQLVDVKTQNSVNTQGGLFQQSPMSLTTQNVLQATTGLGMTFGFRSEIPSFYFNPLNYFSAQCFPQALKEWRY